MTPINPLRVAEKLHHLRRESIERETSIWNQQPRLAEILWTIQWWSLQPGGLERRVEKFVEWAGDRVGPFVMPPAGSGPWTLPQCLPYWEQVRQDAERGCGRRLFLREFDEWSADKPLDDGDEKISRPYYDETLESRDRAELEDGAARFNRDYFKAAFRSIAEGELPALLGDVCERPSCDYLAPWYFNDLIPSLCDYIDHLAGQVKATLAQTRVADMVFKRLDFGIKSSVPTLILGDARIGKTRSVSTWTEMYPGRARLVTTPCDDCMTAFYQAHADAARHGLLACDPHQTIEI